jgi:hypothetical protein
VILFINSGSWGVMLVRLDIEIWEIGEDDTKRGIWKGVK